MNSSSTNPIALIPESEIAILVQLKIFQYLQALGIIVLCYDYILTLPDEVALIWSQKRSLATFIFIAVRYLPFLDLAFLIYQEFAVNPSASACSTAVSIKAWLYVVGITIADGVLVLRTYILWSNNKKVAIVLLVLLGPVVVASGWFVESFLLSLVYVPTVSHTIFPGCFLQNANNALWKNYTISGGYELGLVLLTWYKVLRTNTIKGSMLYRTVVWDGITYYCFILVISIINIIVLLTTPQALQASLSTIHRSVHAIVSWRLILNIRKVAIYGSPTSKLRSTITGRSTDLQESIELHPLEFNARKRPVFSSTGSTFSDLTGGTSQY